MLSNGAYHETTLPNGLLVSTQRVIQRRQEQAYQTTVSQGAGCLPLVLHYTQSETDAMLTHEQVCQQWRTVRPDDLRYFYTSRRETSRD